MSVSEKKMPLAEIFNGVKTPQYFDRQVVRASDLNLDLSSRNEELERMRRLLHGWGIVGGLDVVQVKDSLKVGRGYGVTPTGEEVFLQDGVTVTNLAEHIWACCGPGPTDCDRVEAAEIRAAAIETRSVASWLIARPLYTEDEPRSGVAKGCEHPANKLLPTRRCHGVRLELLCNLPPPHVVDPPFCDELSPHFCHSEKDGRPPFLAMPAVYDDDVSFLVLGQLVCTKADGELFATLNPIDRKTLLPVSLIQQFLSACVCPALESEPPGPIGPGPIGPGPIGPGPIGPGPIGPGPIGPGPIGPGPIGPGPIGPGPIGPGPIGPGPIGPGPIGPGPIGPGPIGPGPIGPGPIGPGPIGPGPVGPGPIGPGPIGPGPIGPGPIGPGPIGPGPIGPGPVGPGPIGPGPIGPGPIGPGPIGPGPIGPGPIGPISGGGRLVDWSDFGGILANENLLGRDRVEPSPFQNRLGFINDRAMIEKLGQAGINGPKEFLGADETAIAEAMDMTVSEVRDAKRTVASLKHLFAGPRF